MTLTLPVLAAARALHVLIFGEDKRAAQEKATRIAPEDAPIRAVAEAAPRLPQIHWAP